VVRRWASLLAYTALVYVTLPAGVPASRLVLRSAAGAWLFGPGLVVVLAAGAIGLVAVLRRRRAPAHGWALLALTTAGYAGALWWLEAQRLERIHLPEYGLLAWLAWRAVGPLVPGVGGWAATALLGSAIGWGDELLQALTPGRVYDLRDVAANALGVVLGLLLLATLRARPAGDARRPMPEAGRLSAGYSA
jgi:hypothetical protein